MLSIDAPVRLYEYRRLERLFFNWTMTYRSDSTFPIPYARIERVMPLPAPIGSSQLNRYIKYFGQKAAKMSPGNGNMAEGKVGLAVQFVSNCHSYSNLKHMFASCDDTYLLIYMENVVNSNVVVIKMIFKKAITI